MDARTGDTRTGDTPALWDAPECPFAIEYLPKVLDDIRLAVVDAFFSLPRGGAEIGGLLLGRHERKRVVITDSIALECEHAFGPSFTLSRPDLARLDELLAAARKNPASTPVGWWHSHTRSEIFLTDADQEIHKRFFPESWQVALVLRPHTFQPTRAGFFFREKDGSMRADASHREFVLEPLPVKPAPSSTAPTAESPAPPLTGEGPVVDIRMAPEHPAPEPVSRPKPVEDAPPPSFLAPPPARPWKVIGFLAVALGAGLAVGAYQTRDRWLPLARLGSAPAPVAVPIALTTLDHDGQLQISWDGRAPEIQRSTGGKLTIADGKNSESIPLDAGNLRSGSFTYVRQGERVNLTLAVNQPDGPPLLHSATFLGKAPAPPAPAPELAAESSALRQERDKLAAENAKLKSEVASQSERIQRLEKALEDVRVARQRELQRKRLENQDAAKQ
jgi:hypothetical protein